MLKYYFSEDNNMIKSNTHQNGCWVSAVTPTDEELNTISQHYNLDKNVLQAALDEDERSRIDVDTDYKMILVNIPVVEEHQDKELYRTIPL